MLFKQLVEIKTLDRQLYKKSKPMVHEAYKIYKSKMPSKLRISITLAFILIKIPLHSGESYLKKYCFKILNRLFIY